MKTDKTPQRIKIGDLSFDSRSEYEAYLYLDKIKGGLQLGRPFRVELLPGTSHFRKKYMEVDFWLGYSPANPLFLIEYKGDWIADKASSMSLLKTRLHLMEVNNPAAFGRLLIIGSQELNLPNMITLQELKTKLKGM
jgi:hypothetical protein